MASRHGHSAGSVRRAGVAVVAAIAAGWSAVDGAVVAAEGMVTGDGIHAQHS